MFTNPWNLANTTRGRAFVREQLPPYARDIYSVFCEHADKRSGECELSVLYIASLTGCCETTVHKWIRVFVEKGLIGRQEQFVDGKQQPNRWTVKVLWTNFMELGVNYMSRLKMMMARRMRRKQMKRDIAEAVRGARNEGPITESLFESSQSGNEKTALERFYERQAARQREKPRLWT